MHDLHGRFRRLDRLATPNLWNEAVGRAAELELGPRRAFNPSIALIAAALMPAALAGTLMVGGWLNRPSPLPEIVTYDNGLIVGEEQCGRIVGIHPASFESQELVAGVDCSFRGWGGTAWSSDGSRLAYLAPEFAAQGGVWVLEAATGETRRLDPCPDVGCGLVDISSDGSLVTYVAYRGVGTSQMVIMEVDSGEEYRVELTGQARRPRFSPDGSRIAIPLIGGRSGIYLVDLGRFDDGQVGDLTPMSGLIDADDVTWSPDGEWIAYTQSGGLGDADGQMLSNGQGGRSGDGIVITRLDGSQTRVLATGPGETGPRLPTWSPDSASVAYVTTPTPAGARQPWMLEVWTVAIDGGEPTRIYESGRSAELGPPDWSPNGEWIAFGQFVFDRPSQSGTYLVRPDGSDLRRASELFLAPVWQPIPKD